MSGHSSLVFDIAPNEWRLLLALGESLPIATRLRVAALASQAMSVDATLVTLLETAVTESPPRIASLTHISTVDYSWTAFLEAWLSGIDDRRWASEPARRCRQAGFSGEAPLPTDRVLVDVLLLRHGPDDSPPEYRLVFTDTVAGRVAEVLRGGVIDNLDDLSPLLRYIAWKWCGDLRFINDEEGLARDAYRSALVVLETECQTSIRLYYLPSILISVLWLEHDPIVWRPWFGAMRQYYANTGIAGVVESIRWRKEFDYHAERAQWLTVNANPAYPVELPASSEWRHLSFISNHAASLIDEPQREQAAAVTACSIRLALAASCFSMLPELVSFNARLFLAEGAYLSAAQAHIRAGRPDMERDIQRLGAEAITSLADSVVNNLLSLRTILRRLIYTGYFEPVVMRDSSVTLRKRAGFLYAFEHS